jgi:hypothetical protein
MAKAKTAQPVFNLAGSPAGLSAFYAQITRKLPNSPQNGSKSQKISEFRAKGTASAPHRAIY